MKRFLIFVLLHFLFHAQVQGQTAVLSLEEALEIARANNIGVRQSQLQVESSLVNHRQAKMNLLPTASAIVNHGINQGRSIDPFTNTYVNQEILYGSYGAGASLLLFNGLSLQNSIRQTDYAHDAAQLELQQARENLSLNVMLAYLQVLNNEELVGVAQKQVLVTSQQLERLETLHKQGAINPPLIAELRGQLKAEELALLNTRQAVETAKLALAQLMNVPYNKGMELEPLEIEALVIAGQPATEAGEVYAAAEGQLALVKAAALRRKSAEAGIRAMRGNYYPSLFLNGNMNSNYSSVATMNGERIEYQDQLRNNVFYNLSLNLRIPILNSFEAHNRVKLAKLELQQVSLAEENTRALLRQEVEQAQLNLNNAQERYEVLLEQERAFNEAFRAAEIRFNAGAGTPVDYLLAKNNLDRANINLVMGKYEYLLRMKILDYYMGR